MSTHKVILVPVDPHHIPDESTQTKARNRLRELVPEITGLSTTVSEKINFFYCGENWERTLCPGCRAAIPSRWWHDRIGDDYVEGGFRMATYLTPCCKAACTLNDLVYEFPQSFGRFALEFDDPGCDKLSADVISECERMLGTRVRVIYQMT